MFERIRALHGSGGADRRYPSESPEEYLSPEEVEDPHTLDDGSKQGLAERMQDNWHWILALGLLFMTALILMAIYFGRYMMTIALNPWTHRFLAGGGIAVSAYKLGQTSQRKRIQKQDELTLYDPDSRQSNHFLGRYLSLEGMSHDVFIPIKGFRKWGHAPEPYRIGELSRELVQRHNHNPQAQAKIRLHPAVVTVEATERGRKITQLTAGIDPDPFGRETNLEATLPDMASTETVSDLKGELEKAGEEIGHLENKLDQLRRQRNDAREEARKNFETVRSEVREDAKIFEGFVRSTSATRSVDDDDAEDQRRDGSLRNRASNRNGGDD